MKTVVPAKPIHRRVVALPVPGGTLMGDLSVPEAPQGIVLFAHGSGSGRKSPRNRWVARQFEHANFATLLVDLLTPEEAIVDEETRALRFDVALLADRLARVTLTREVMSSDLPVGYFGASTGAAAALMAAARLPDIVHAVVSRGGRPDLAGDALEGVHAPTLLIVGGEDREVIALNRTAFVRLDCHRELRIVPGATHLFEEPGALDMVADMATHWFTEYLVR